MDDSKPDDPYHRIDYRRVIAWPARIEREWPFLEKHLGGAPDRSVLDLGCGTGEHAAFLLQQGWQVVGVDRSESMLEAATEYAADGLEFVQGDLTLLSSLVDRRFGAAICLGNVLPSLEDEDLVAMLTQTAGQLQPGGVLILQILNYTRILDQNIRFLPLNFRADEEAGGEIVFLRFLDRVDDTHVAFRPTTLRIPDDEGPVEVMASRHLMVRAWQHSELAARLGEAGFSQVAYFGDIAGGDFDPHASHDLIAVAVANH